MDVNNDLGGYPRMGPLVEPLPDTRAEQGDVERGQDYLLCIDDPRVARAALEASDGLVMPDARATAWLVTDRLVTGTWYVALVTAALGQDSFAGDFPSSLLTAVLLAGVPVLVLDVGCNRAVGLRPRQQRQSGWSWLAQVLAVAVGFSVLVSRDFEVRPVGAVMGVAVLVSAALPVVRWWHASRSHRQTPAWPPGAQAYAILSVLAAVEAASPNRLLAGAGLDTPSGEQWLVRLRAEQSVYGGRRRHPLVAEQYVGLTVPGRQRLHRMRADLERLCAQAPLR